MKQLKPRKIRNPYFDEEDYDPESRMEDRIHLSKMHRPRRKIRRRKRVEEEDY